MHRCPFSLARREHYDVVRAVIMQEQGMLPGQGGWADQPAILVDAMAVVSEKLNRYRKRQQDREEREAQVRSRRR